MQISMHNDTDNKNNSNNNVCKNNAIILQATTITLGGPEAATVEVPTIIMSITLVYNTTMKD